MTTYTPPKKIYCLCCLLLLLIVIVLFIVGSNFTRKSAKLYEHLYAYKKHYITQYVSSYGYTDVDLNDVSRNWSGTTIYVHNYYRYDGSSIILSISKKGIAKLVPPATIAHLNDKGEFIAWYDDIKKGVHFKNGYIRTCPIDFAVDPSGQYFVIQTKPMLVEIGSIDNPEKTLFKARLDAEKIFAKNGKIYLFARNYQNIRGPGDFEQHEIQCQVFKRVGTTFEYEKEFHIRRPVPRPSPFAVVDFDPWSEKVLVVDVRDVPLSFLTAWYLFDIKTNTLTYVGRANGYGFFLKEDILGIQVKKK